MLWVAVWAVSYSLLNTGFGGILGILIRPLEPEKLNDLSNTLTYGTYASAPKPCSYLEMGEEVTLLCLVTIVKGYGSEPNPAPQDGSSFSRACSFPSSSRLRPTVHLRTGQDRLFSAATQTRPFLFRWPCSFQGWLLHKQATAVTHG